VSKQKYEELINEVSYRLGIEDASSLYKLCSLRVNEIDFTLTHGNFIDDDTLMIYCDLGEIPKEMESVITERLMEANLTMFGKIDTVYALNPENGHALLIQPMSLTETDYDLLMLKLSELTAFTYEWRSNYFLAPQELKMLHQRPE
jgi:hypothetical protein